MFASVVNVVNVGAEAQTLMCRKLANVPINPGLGDPSPSNGDKRTLPGLRRVLRDNTMYLDDVSNN
jgi:hypothetical protein